jgi:hypothetical protein
VESGGESGGESGVESGVEAGVESGGESGGGRMTIRSDVKAIYMRKTLDRIWREAALMRTDSYYEFVGVLNRTLYFDAPILTQLINERKTE